MAGPQCFAIRRCQREHALATVAYVRGEHNIESLVKQYDAGRTEEELSTGVYYWAEKVPQRNCSRQRRIIIPPLARNPRADEAG
jgi:hypothetical protein